MWQVLKIFHNYLVSDKILWSYRDQLNKYMVYVSDSSLWIIDFIVLISLNFWILHSYRYDINILFHRIPLPLGLGKKIIEYHLHILIIICICCIEVKELFDIAKRRSNLKKHIWINSLIIYLILLLM